MSLYPDSYLGLTNAGGAGHERVPGSEICVTVPLNGAVCFQQLFIALT